MALERAYGFSWKTSEDSDDGAVYAWSYFEAERRLAELVSDGRGSDPSFEAWLHEDHGPERPSVREFGEERASLIGEFAHRWSISAADGASLWYALCEKFDESDADECFKFQSLDTCRDAAQPGESQ